MEFNQTSKVVNNLSKYDGFSVDFDGENTNMLFDKACSRLEKTLSAFRTLCLSRLTMCDSMYEYVAVGSFFRRELPFIVYQVDGSLRECPDGGKFEFSPSSVDRLFPDTLPSSQSIVLSRLHIHNIVDRIVVKHLTDTAQEIPIVADEKQCENRIVRETFANDVCSSEIAFRLVYADIVKKVFEPIYQVNGK